MLVEKLKQRIVIENLYPEVDCGRYAVKRCVGDQLEVWVDIFMDGHDLLDAEIVYGCAEQKSSDNFTSVKLIEKENDRWYAAFTLNEVGAYSYTVKAWLDHFATWQRNTKRSQAAGQDISMEIKEGRLLFESLPLLKSQEASAAGLVKSTLNRLKASNNDELAKFLLSDEATSFYRAHDPHDGEVTFDRTLTVWVDRKRAEFSAWYEMFPRSQGVDETKSSTFADCEWRLPEIQDMGFDVIYLPPIHPIGFTQRKGKNNALASIAGEPGSPYAIGAESGGHKAIHPDLGTLDDFKRFVKAAKNLGFEIALDFAVQVSRDHPYIKQHPEWFKFRPDGSLKYAENPPKKYQDIANVNFDSGELLWQELKSVVDFWIEKGVTIFRVDNPHTKPFHFWEWLISEIHKERPDIIFLAEAFTRPKVMYFLAKAGFTQSYSYFTWRNTKSELVEYLTELTKDWPKEYFRPNFFPTTPDILPEYLQKSGRAGFITRLTLAATLGANYGIYNGYELCESTALPGKEEYADSEKYQYKVRDWNAAGNIKPFIKKLNEIRNTNTALQNFKSLRFYPSTSDQVLFYGKSSRDESSIVFIAVNLDPHNVQESYIDMPLAAYGIEPNTPYMLDDLLLGHSWTWTGSRQHLRLDPTRNPVALFRIRQS